jgi:hypothetical protein
MPDDDKRVHADLFQIKLWYANTRYSDPSCCECSVHVVFTELANVIQTEY